MQKSNLGGFTLIELMITVVIVGILAAIAYPSYTSYVAQTRRSDATINLSRIAAQQEKFFTECGRYTANFNGTIFDPNPANRCTGLGAGPTAGSFTTTDGFYTITVPILLPGPAPASVPGGGGFTLSAAPAAGSSQFTADVTKCSTFTITNTGIKTATGSDGGPTGGKCWKK